MSAYDSNTEFKEVPTENEGSVSKYGSNQTREIMQILNGEVVPSRLVKMANPWRWIDTYEMLAITQPANASNGTVRIFTDIVDGKVKVLKSDGTVRSLEEQPGTSATHKNQHKVGGTDAFVKADIMAAAARYLETLLVDPTSDSGRYWLIGADLKYWDNQATPVKQTLERLSMKNAANGYAGLDGTSKIQLAQVPTISDTNIATHTSTRISITNKAQLNSQIAYRDATLWLTDAMIAAAGITTRSKLPSAISYKDGNNDYGAFYEDRANMTVPANPPLGRRRLFVDAADSKLKVKTSTGAVIDLEATAAPPLALYLPDGSVPIPSVGHWGAIWPCATDGTAMLAGVEMFGNLGSNLSTSTRATTFSTDAVDDATAGWRTRVPITRRSQFPSIKTRLVHDVFTERTWWGFSSDAQLPTGGAADTPLNGKTGVLIGFSDTTPNFTVKWNNGAATEQTFTTTTAKINNAFNYTIVLNETAANLVVGFADVNVVTTTTAVPTNNMYMHFQVESVGGTAASASHRYSYITVT